MSGRSGQFSTRDDTGILIRRKVPGKISQFNQKEWKQKSKAVKKLPTLLSIPSLGFTSLFNTHEGRGNLSLPKKIQMMTEKTTSLLQEEEVAVQVVEIER